MFGPLCMFLRCMPHFVFPGKSIWVGKFPCKVAFFVWTAALNFIMAVNSLVKRKIVVLIDM